MPQFVHHHGLLQRVPAWTTHLAAAVMTPWARQLGTLDAGLKIR